MIYESTKPNVIRDGYEDVAERVSRYVRNARGQRICVYVDWEGKVQWRPRCRLHASNPLPDADLIGTYDRHVRVETIEGDLIERMRELTRRAA